MRESFAKFFGANPDSVFLFAKGRVALYTVLKALGVGPGDEVIVPGYTCVMVPSAPIFLGATCKYADINPGTYNVAPEALAPLYSPKTKALIIQHTYGIAQEMEPVLRWAKEKRVPVIEDCCHAFGSKYAGQLCGTFGVASFFSGQWNKPFSTGLGGMLLVNNPDLRRAVASIYGGVPEVSVAENLRFKAQILLYNNFVKPSTTHLITNGYRMLTRLGVAAGSSSNAEFEGVMPANYLRRMAPVQMAEGEKNLQKISDLLNHRHKLVDYYHSKLGKALWKTFMPSEKGENCLLRYPVRVGNKKALLALAGRSGVELGSWFETPLHPEGIEMKKFGYGEGQCPASESASREVVNLPTHQKITFFEAKRILDFFEKKADLC